MLFRSVYQNVFTNVSDRAWPIYLAACLFQKKEVFMGDLNKYCNWFDHSSIMNQHYIVFVFYVYFMDEYLFSSFRLLYTFYIYLFMIVFLTFYKSNSCSKGFFKTIRHRFELHQIFMKWNHNFFFRSECFKFYKIRKPNAGISQIDNGIKRN